MERLYFVALEPEKHADFFMKLERESTYALAGSGPHSRLENRQETVKRLTMWSNSLFTAMIHLKSDDSLIGYVALFSLLPQYAFLRHRDALYGISISQAYLSKGYGTEATKYLIGRAFDDFNLNKISLEANSSNKRAIRCYEKAGFKVEAIRRESWYHEGQFHDHVCMGILRRDWLSSTGKTVQVQPNASQSLQSQSLSAASIAPNGQTRSKTPIRPFEMERLYLRAIEPEQDYEFLSKADREPSHALAQYNPPTRLDNKATSIQRYESWTQGIWSSIICLKENDEPIGSIGLFKGDPQFNLLRNREAQLGLSIVEKHQNKGYGTEVVRYVCSRAFLDFNLHRVSLDYIDINAKGAAAYAKVGFVQEGIKRESWYHEGKYHNQVIMGLLREDLGT